MGVVTPVESVSHWNTTLRAAKEKNQPIFVDFYATWCGPCKVISPVFEQLASQYPNAVFLKVDVDQLQPIAAKYQITAMPTFYAINEHGPVDSLRGADSRGLAAMIAKHAATPPAPPLPAAAEAAKTEGNSAFGKGDYVRAVECYSQAISHAPKSAILHGNRAFAYIRMTQSPDVPKDQRAELRSKAIEDARSATQLDEKWAKGWVRLGEALRLPDGEDVSEAVSESPNAAARRTALEGAQQALQKAVGLTEGKVKAEAQAILDDVQAQLRAL